MDITQAIAELKRTLDKAQFAYSENAKYDAPVAFEVDTWHAVGAAVAALEVAIAVFVKLRDTDSLCPYPADKCRKSRIFEELAKLAKSKEST
jgi:hypothetical protein